MSGEHEGEFPQAKVSVSFNQSTTGKGEGYRVSVNDEATQEDVDRAVAVAARARLAALAALGRVCCGPSGEGEAALLDAAAVNHIHACHTCYRDGICGDGAALLDQARELAEVTA
ncbi:MAG TPA: hypothetical protein VIB47_07145 [Dehalococcoidia bacterium]|jgi:hypothetical protein